VRIPDVIRRAGLRLSRGGYDEPHPRVGDYAEALESGAAVAILRVHPSNFRMEGCRGGDPAARLPRWPMSTVRSSWTTLARRAAGRGGVRTRDEPTPMERLASGADLVCFSGDKLVGGPQAGLLVGRSDLIARIQGPLARAMRPDKVTLAAVAATLGLYRAGLATTEIPVWRMTRRRREALRRRAEILAGKLARLGHTPVVIRSRRPSVAAHCPARRCRRGAWRCPGRSRGRRSGGCGWACQQSSRASRTTPW
jgi:L-seryl-tRNA(Ser) seleniumtransferase